MSNKERMETSKRDNTLDVGERKNFRCYICGAHNEKAPEGYNLCGECQRLTYEGDY
jgi:hypothetical protein